MGIWLLDVINLTGRSMGLLRGSRHQNLNFTTTRVNTVTGYFANRYILSLGTLRVQVYDYGSWKLRIVLQQDGKQDLSVLWDILRNRTSYSFVFDRDNIWFYSVSRDLSLNGAVSDGWRLPHSSNVFSVANYNIQRQRIEGIPADAVVEEVGPAPPPPVEGEEETQEEEEKEKEEKQTTTSK